MSHRKPVIQGVAHVIEGNFYRAARPPGGGLCVFYATSLLDSFLSMERNLEDKKWCRVVKVLSVVLLVIAFFAPVLTGNSLGGGWVLDGLINVAFWLIVLAFAKMGLMYVVFGGKKD